MEENYDIKDKKYYRRKLIENRWYLYIMLTQNPSLKKYRKKAIQNTKPKSAIAKALCKLNFYDDGSRKNSTDDDFLKVYPIRNGVIEIYAEADKSDSTENYLFSNRGYEKKYFIENEYPIKHQKNIENCNNEVENDNNVENDKTLIVDDFKHGLNYNDFKNNLVGEALTVKPEIDYTSTEKSRSLDNETEAVVNTIPEIDIHNKSDSSNIYTDHATANTKAHKEIRNSVYLENIAGKKWTSLGNFDNARRYDETGTDNVQVMDQKVLLVNSDDIDVKYAPIKAPITYI